MSHFAPADRSPNLTILRNKSWMGKRFFIDELGQLQKQANGIFTDGICKAQAAHSAKELMRIITALKPTDALCLGIPAAANGTHSVASRRIQHKRRAFGMECLSRTKENFAFAKGVGWLLIDYDDKGIPDLISGKIECEGGTLQVMLGIWPELADADLVLRPSSSAGVHMAGEQPSANNGFHLFVRLEQAQSAPDALQALHARCWDSGYGYHMISKSGQLLDRSIIDITVGSPERLIFTSEPILGDGVCRTAPPAFTQTGSALTCPMPPQSFTWRRNRDIDRQEMQPKAQKVREQYLEAQSADYARSHGVSISKARDVITSRIEVQLLQDADTLELPNGQTTPVGTLLDSISKEQVIACADPLEGRAYNPTAAAVIWNEGHKSPVLISHAHGLQTVFSFARFQRKEAANV